MAPAPSRIASITDRDHRSIKIADCSHLIAPAAAAASRSAGITSELSGRLPLRRISTTGTLPLYQGLHGINE